MCQHLIWLKSRYVSSSIKIATSYIIAATSNRGGRIWAEKQWRHWNVRSSHIIVADLLPGALIHFSDGGGGGGGKSKEKFKFSNVKNFASSLFMLNLMVL